MVSSEHSYNHRFVSGAPVPWQPGKAVCVGRNFADHAAELNNAVPDQALLFLKPASAMVAFTNPLRLASRFGCTQYETEMTLLIGKRLSCCKEKEASTAIAGLGIGLDLTLRELQSDLKAKGYPWERAKAFDGSCVLSSFIAVNDGIDLQNIRVRLWRNGRLAQDGNTELMLFPVLSLLQDISRSFTLMPGDVVMTGTPKGVGELHEGDKLVAELGTLVSAEATVVFENA